MPSKPAGPTPRRIRLRTLEEILRELRRLYSEWRSHQLPSSDATKGAFLLQTMARILVDATLEGRLQAAERQLSDLLRQLESRKK